MNFVSKYGGNVATGKHTGMKGIRAALDAGLTINQIRDQLKREGIQTGTKATEFLAARPAESFIAQYGGNEETMAHSGLKAVKAAEATGLSKAQVEQMGKEQGISFGSGAQEYFNQPSPEEIFASRIKNLQDTFTATLKQQQDRFQEMQRSQEQRMATLQQQMQSTAAQQTRPTVAGVKMAEGAGGTAMQIARRGVTGAFGRRGMRISGLNV